MNYKKYRWMYTSSGKLVLGGKSAEQNEEVVRVLMDEVKKGKDYLVMHTSAPGSPFAILYSDKYDVKDIEECAVFCASFSRAWRSGKRKVNVDIFYASQIFKDRGMKVGTFGVFKKIKSMEVGLKLCFEVQKGKLRAIPYREGRKSCLVCVYPGKIPKERAAELIGEVTGFKKQEVLEALPTGGFRVEGCK